MASISLTSSSNDQTGIQFAHLPLDIHNLILDLLSPSDLIALRKTCKIMAEATSQRLLWLRVVQRMCQENTVYQPSYPTDDMSLLELEFVAMGPKNWESLAFSIQSLEDEMPSFATHIIKPDLPIDRFDSRDLYLVPGGRYLVVLQLGYLCMWDLGYVSAIRPIRPEMQEVARVRTNCTSYTVHTSPDGSALRVLAVAPKSHDTLTKYNYDVFEIFPWKPSPQFTLIASLSITSAHNLHFTSVCGNSLTLVYGPIIKIWDFMTDEWASWNTGRDEHRQILMTKDTIVLIDDHDLSVWDVPKLISKASAHSCGTEPDTPLEPRCTLNYADGYHPPSSFVCKGLCDWYTGSPQPLWYDLLDSSNECSLQFDRFEADISDLQNVETPIKRLPSLQLPPTVYLDSTLLLPYRACGQSIVAPWGSEKGIHCHIGITSPEETRQSFVTLRSTQGVQNRGISFCPVSGRLVHVSSSDEIEVVDYLWPTNASFTANFTHQVSYERLDDRSAPVDLGC